MDWDSLQTVALQREVQQSAFALVQLVHRVSGYDADAALAVLAEAGPWHREPEYVVLVLLALVAAVAAFGIAPTTGP